MRRSRLLGSGVFCATRLFVLLNCLLVSGILPAPPAAAPGTGKPVRLTCDSLSNPLGIDDIAPRFSWQLQDSRFGAHQSAYQVQVASDPELLAAGKADVWDSGRIASGQSVGVGYAGPALTPEKRYYWRVLLWDQDSQPYPASDITWWETGLLGTENWRAQWIGSESVEHRSLRESSAQWISYKGAPSYKPSSESRHDFRASFQLQKPVRHASLYVTGKDTASAWLNGKQVLTAQPLPPWKQTSWQTYVHSEVSSQLHADKNTLAVEIIRYYIPDSWMNSDESKTPMSACLIVEFQDGSYVVFQSDSHWKASLNAADGWSAADFDDSSWDAATIYPFTGSAMDGAVFGKPLPTESVKLLRHTFDVSKPVKSARLYATALGAYEFHLNGRRIGDQILAPGWTDYRIQVPYQVYDVTPEVTIGKNALAAFLAPGWYTTPLMWAGKGYNYGNTPPALRAQLRIEHTDGSVDWVLTDESWRADDSPISFAEIYDGETYDARREQAGWDTPGFDHAKWRPAELVHPSEPAIVAQSFPPVREEKLLDAKSITTPKPGVTVFDFGQNLAGIAKLRVSGSAGQQIQLRFAEILNADGTLYTDNLRTAKATDRFVLSGKDPEEFQPRFTFHGYRYVEVTGLTSPPDLNTLRAVVLHTDAPFTAQFHSGSAMINQLWNNILWGQRSNFISVPTDCPQRDERLGWTADAQVFWRTAAYNMDLTTFSQKFSADIRGTQTGTDMFGIFAPGTATSSSSSAAGWSDAGVIIPWTAWSQYGDTRVAEQNWTAMERYLSAIQSANPDYLWRKEYGIAFGDWLAPDEHTSEELLATALWAYDVSLMQQMARALHRDDDTKKYAALAEKIKAAFNKAYVHPDGFVGAMDSRANSSGPPAKDAPKVPVDTQTGYVLALHMNLLPDHLRAAAADKLVAKIEARHWTIGTGFLGTPALLETLTRTGHADVSYRLLLNTQYPSWGYMIEHGATTMWERWDGDQKLDDPGMNSFNHYAYGAVGEWLYRFAAGIDYDTDDPGFHHILLHPAFDANLGSVEATYQSPYGPIESNWSVSGHLTAWKVVIPPNTRALLILPVKKETFVLVDGKDIHQNQWVHLVRSEDDTQIFTAQPGSYSFTMQN
jgi:alpha-L-rhamnosidase